MRMVIAGGTGLIGRRLVNRLLSLGHKVTVLSRSAGGAPSFEGPVVTLDWNARDIGGWAASIENADAVVNLAGTNLGGGRWTDNRKRSIIESRVAGTKALVEAMRAQHRRPSVFVSASAVGYYGNVTDVDVDENHGNGSDFLSEVCRRWEVEANKAADLGIRVVTPRTGLVLDADGGALPRLVLPFRLFVGGPLGSGQQWMSWIHADDEVSALIHLIDNSNLNGAVNLTAPEPVRMKEFSAILGRVVKRPSWSRVPAFVLKLVLGEMSGMVLTGQRVVPTRLLECGFRFRFDRLEPALQDLLKR